MTMTKNVWAAMVAMLTTLAVVTVFLFVPANSASATPGSSAADPIVVTNVADVPAGAVEDIPSTYNTANTCDTTRSWVNTVPGQNAVTHKEYKYKKSVKTYKTQYHFSKFTQIRTQAPATKTLWANFSPNKQQGTFTGPPTWPTDSRGTWHIHYSDGGPDKTKTGVFQNGSGNGSWFYRQVGTTPAWSAWSAWTEWTPETHTSWQDSNAPLGTPQFHSRGTYADGTKWERQWQAQWDGGTRQVETGSTWEYTDWTTEILTAPWVKIAERTVTDSEATNPVTTYYAWTDGKVCEVVTPTPTPEPPVVTPTPTPEPPVVTPPTPQPPKDKVKPFVAIRANCVGNVAYVANNTKSNVAVPFRYLNDGKVKKVVVKAGAKKVVVEKAAANSVAWIKTKGDSARVVVPGKCHVPHAGH